METLQCFARYALQPGSNESSLNLMNFVRFPGKADVFKSLLKVGNYHGIPLNFSWCWNKMRKTGQMWHRAYKEFIKKDSGWKTECCKEDKGSQGALYRNRVWITGTKVKKSCIGRWIPNIQDTISFTSTSLHLRNSYFSSSLQLSFSYRYNIMKFDQGKRVWTIMKE